MAALPPRLLYILGLGAVVAACSPSPEAQFRDGCRTMARADDRVGDDKVIPFCDCLTERSEEMSDEHQVVLGELMAGLEDSDAFQARLQDVTSTGELSFSASAKFLSHAKTCSVNAAM